MVLRAPVNSFKGCFAQNANVGACKVSTGEEQKQETFQSTGRTTRFEIGVIGYNSRICRDKTHTQQRTCTCKHFTQALNHKQWNILATCGPQHRASEVKHNARVRTRRAASRAPGGLRSCGYRRTRHGSTSTPRHPFATLPTEAKRTTQVVVNATLPSKVRCVWLLSVTASPKVHVIATSDLHKNVLEE